MGSENKVPMTYESLYDVLLREKQRDALQSLPASFWPDALSYLREKQAMLEGSRNKVDLFSAAEREKTHQQIKNIRRILKEIYDRREKKIIDIALNKSRTGSKIIDTGNQLDVEKQLFEALVNEMNFFRQGLLNNVLDLRDPSMWLEGESAQAASLAPPPVHSGMTFVRIVADIPQFVGSDLDVFGPYQAGDTAVLPSEIADILVAQASAVSAETPEQGQTELDPKESEDNAGINREIGSDPAQIMPEGPIPEGRADSPHIRH